MIAGTTSRALARALSLVSLTAPLAVVLVAGGAPSAFASGGLISPTPAAGAIVTGGASVQAQGQLSRGTASTTLTFTGPDGYSYNTTWSCPSSLTTTSPCKSSVLTADLAPGGVPRHNGQWTARLSNGASDSRTFWTNVAPASTPANVTATATNPAPGATTGSIALTWTYGGNEPDLWGYRLADGNGWSADVSASSAGCGSGGTCSYSKQYDNAPGSTVSYSFTVAALRDSCKSAGCPVSDDTVAGSSSDVTSQSQAQLVTPQPPPSPTPSPTSSGTPGGTTGGTTGGSTPGSTTGGTSGGSTSGTTGGTSGGSTGTKTGSGTKTAPIPIPTLNPIVAQRQAFALNFNSFSPKLGIPKLPPLPATTFPETVGAASENTYQPTLPYKAQPAKTTTSFFSSPLGAVKSIDTAQLAKSLAMALILIVTAAHLRLLMRNHRPE